MRKVFLMKKVPLKFNLFIIFLVIMGFMGENSLLAMDVNIQEKVKKYHPKLESILGELAEKYSQSKIGIQEFARQRSIHLEDDQVKVILVPFPGKDTSTIDQASLVSCGAVVEAVSRHLMRVKVPITRLEEIADRVEGVSYIRLPYRPLSVIGGEKSLVDVSSFLKESANSLQQISSGVISEGVELSGASDYHNSGYKGQNTKVAVIDIGFANLTRSIAHDELPDNVIYRNHTHTNFESGRTHGTAVAEIVYDMAPETQLYLVKIADEVDLENAKDECIYKDGIDIINHSWGWPATNFTDGTGLICEIADDARANGILWVNAAGNSARSHYQAFFTDTDNDGWHDFRTNPRDEMNAFEYTYIENRPLEVYLTWNCWPVTSEDYDLYLYDSSLNPVASSTTRQSGTQPPVERIILDDAESGTYYLMIKKYSATGDQELKVFANSLEYQTARYSIWPPADAIGTIAVGYINKENWLSGPQGNSSAQGPTNDGRIKPDIMGPSNILSFTWGRGNYTSAATPHVSGAVAQP